MRIGTEITALKLGKKRVGALRNMFKLRSDIMNSILSGIPYNLLMKANMIWNTNHTSQSLFNLNRKSFIKMKLR